MIADLEAWLIAMLQTVFDSLGWLGVAGIMAFENATGLTPSEVTLGLAGWMLLSAHNAPFTLVFVGALYAAAGSLLGASATYWAARLGGRPLIDKLAHIARIDPAHITKAEARFNRNGTALVLLGRLVPTFRTIITIPAGLSRMPYPQFALLTFCGAYFWCAILIGAGYLLGHEWMLLRDEVIGYVEKFAPYILGGMILTAAGWLTARYYPMWKKMKFAFVITPSNDRNSAGGQKYEK